MQQKKWQTALHPMVFALFPDPSTSLHFYKQSAPAVHFTIV
jgi:hypothetical protein